MAHCRHRGIKFDSITVRCFGVVLDFHDAVFYSFEIEPVVYEPVIVQHLALTGSKDEQPLLDMIRARRFAVMITIDPALHFTALRTPAVDAAMRESYPVVTEDAPGLWVHRPQ